MDSLPGCIEIEEQNSSSESGRWFRPWKLFLDFLNKRVSYSIFEVTEDFSAFGLELNKRDADDNTAGHWAVMDPLMSNVLKNLQQLQRRGYEFIYDPLDGTEGNKNNLSPQDILFSRHADKIDFSVALNLLIAMGAVFHRPGDPLSLEGMSLPHIPVAREIIQRSHNEHLQRDKLVQAFIEGGFRITHAELRAREHADRAIFDPTGRNDLHRDWQLAALKSMYPRSDSRNRISPPI